MERESHIAGTKSIGVAVLRRGWGVVMQSGLETLQYYSNDEL